MSEYLSDEEQVERLKSWWDENGTFLVFGLLVTILAIGGWNYYGSYKDEVGEKSSQSYRDYLELEKDSRSEAAEKLTEEFGGSAVHILALFDQAKEKVSGGDISGAEALLSEAVDIASNDLLLDLSRIRLAKVQYQLEKSREALGTLQKVKSKGYLSWALELKGDMHVDLGELELAHQSYEAALKELGEGVERPLLKLKLDNSAPFNGKFVLPETSLSQAVKEAEEVLSAQDSDDTSND